MEATVGTLFYDGEGFELDDRTLFHIQMAVSTKLRRGENFFLSWQLPVERGSGRHTVWVDNGVPFRIYYSGSRPITLNRDWVEALLETAARGSGMFVIPEQEILPKR